MNPTQTSVLIADGDINLSTVLADYLRSISFNVDVTNNAETTLDAIKRKKYDICLMELSFADGSGFEIMKTLRDSNNTLPIVVLTTRSGRDDIIRAFELGCDDYITKPF